MIGPGSDLRVLICTKPVDFRLGIDGLVALIQNQLGFDPYAGGIAYVFRAKRKDRCKILLWDQTGLVLVTKRLEDTGGFCWPQVHDGTYRLTAAEFSVLFSGADWRRVRSKRRPLAPKVDLANTA
ncbi:IS66 family insertion sequence element accessory protein TnpB [Sphingobium cloacae]|uniref:Transposase n=2 Tax=Sphingomonadaceae TaxID=41297 RepID=A0A1E1F8U5_9SPHN|nr:IS66 family insertion sequence element accessory protein TnpB [Sphingobium cloacae]BAI43696.1 IS66 family transposase [Sphingomonas sp. NP5]BAV66907.1 transposase [Sphingobium cloacae]